MKTYFYAMLFALMLPLNVFAQTTVTVRTATDDSTYHFAEVIHQAANGLLTGVGYVDADNPTTYREVYGGAGRVILQTSRLAVKVMAFVNSATGDDADGTASIVGVIARRYHVTSRPHTSPSSVLGSKLSRPSRAMLSKPLPSNIYTQASTRLCLTTLQVSSINCAVVATVTKTTPVIITALTRSLLYDEKPTKSPSNEAK